MLLLLYSALLILWVADIYGLDNFPLVIPLVSLISSRAKTDGLFALQALLLVLDAGSAHRSDSGATVGARHFLLVLGRGQNFDDLGHGFLLRHLFLDDVGRCCDLGRIPHPVVCRGVAHLTIQRGITLEVLWVLINSLLIGKCSGVVDLLNFLEKLFLASG